MNKILEKLAQLLVDALWERLAPELPKLAATVARAVGAEVLEQLPTPADLAKIPDSVVDKITDAIPGELDDRLFDGLASRIVGLFDPARFAGQVVDQLTGRIPFLGGKVF